MSQFDFGRAHDLIDGFAPNSGFTCRFNSVPMVGVRCKFNAALSTKPTHSPAVTPGKTSDCTALKYSTVNEVDLRGRADIE